MPCSSKSKIGSTSTVLDSYISTSVLMAFGSCVSVSESSSLKTVADEDLFRLLKDMNLRMILVMFVVVVEMGLVRK